MQINAKNPYFEMLERTLFIKSGSLPLTFQKFFTELFDTDNSHMHGSEKAHNHIIMIS